MNYKTSHSLQTVGLMGVIAFHSSCGPAADTVGRPAIEAIASLRDASGAEIGTATFARDDGGSLRVDIEVRGLVPDKHGIHIHAVGSCDSVGTTPFGAAGGHLNPLAKSHGLMNPAGPHAGDLPNLEVAANGAGRLSATTNRVTLNAEASGLIDADGAALVIHAAADDQLTDPAGNSGARIACGVIQRTP